VSHRESVLRPAAICPDRFHTWILTAFLRTVSHRRMSLEMRHDLRDADAFVWS
jgi:FAD-dependent urate hydroxylase